MTAPMPARTMKIPLRFPLRQLNEISLRVPCVQGIYSGIVRSSWRLSNVLKTGNLDALAGCHVNALTLKLLNIKASKHSGR